MDGRGLKNYHITSELKNIPDNTDHICRFSVEDETQPPSSLNLVSSGPTFVIQGQLIEMTYHPRPMYSVLINASSLSIRRK